MNITQPLVSLVDVKPIADLWDREYENHGRMHSTRAFLVRIEVHVYDIHPDPPDEAEPDIVMGELMVFLARYDPEREDLWREPDLRPGQTHPFRITNVQVLRVGGLIGGSRFDQVPLDRYIGSPEPWWLRWPDYEGIVDYLAEALQAYC